MGYDSFSRAESAGGAFFIGRHGRNQAATAKRAEAVRRWW
jgi:hypothetical protein